MNECNKYMGVVYIATGKNCVDEVLISAASLKKHMPDLSVTLFSDIDVKSKYFDNVIKIKEPKYSFEDKVRYISKSPYDLTLFLDNDTYICDDVSGLFDLLDRFDIAAAHVPSIGDLVKNIPESFTSFNNGVVAFKKSSKTKLFFSNWLKLYLRDKKRSHINAVDLKIIEKSFQKKLHKKKGIRSQASFKEALYNSNLRIATLTRIYNFKGKCGFVHGKVKIIHGHRRNPDLIEKIINSKLLPRVYIWGNKELKVFFPEKI